MKTSIYCRSKKKWTSEQEALLDVLKQNPTLTEEQLIAEHDEKQFRWSLKQETNSSSSDSIVGCLFIIVVIIIGIVFGADYFDNSSANDVQNESSVNESSVNDNNQSETSTSDNNNSIDNNRKIICPNCKGTGGDIVKKECDSCNGAGFTRAYVTAMGMNYDKCSNCNATGKVKVKIPCEVCYGEGRVKEYE